MPVTELSDVISRNIEQHLREMVNTCIPGTVFKVDKKSFSKEQVVDVVPSIKELNINGAEIKLPKMLNVPVMFPSGGGTGVVTFPMKAGDPVLILFSQRSLQKWKITGAGGWPVVPEDKRYLSQTDAICLPGLFNKKVNMNPDPDNVQVRFDNNVITLKEGGAGIDMDTPGDVNINAGGSVNITSGAAVAISAVTNVDIDGATINLNMGGGA
jgi:hypothetical protein